MSTDRDYEAAANWAETDMTVSADPGTARRGAAAADLGRDLLRRAAGQRRRRDRRRRDRRRRAVARGCPHEHIEQRGR